jgi:hypothetical protein
MGIREIIEKECAQYVDISCTGEDNHMYFPHTYDQLCFLLLDKGYSALITDKGHLVLYHQNQELLH